MSTAMIAELRQQARLRRALIEVVFALPWLSAAVCVAWRWGGAFWILPVLVLLGFGLHLGIRLRRMDPDWVARALDARFPELEDSSALLLRVAEPLPNLVRWQRARIGDRLQALRPRPDLRAPWPRLRWLLSFLAAAAFAAAAVYGAWISQAQPAPALASKPSASAVLPQLRAIDLRITPPAYTGLPPRHQDVLPARVVEGARLAWSLRFERAPAKVALLFHDGSRVDLQLRDGAWVGERVIERSSLYRVQADDQASPLQRLEVIRDLPPRIRVQSPERSLSLLDVGQTRWSLAFEASDDYGLGAAQLQITLAQGSGENITVTRKTLALSGQGDARARRYRHELDLPALGFAVGDDVVVRLVVSDRRTPNPQSTRSASFLLRWPPAAGADATGVEGLVTRTLPAYFRSQRQIIIDSEALIAERRKLSADHFLGKSDSIGVDQRVLRLRYGQFLGEEAEGGRHETEGPALAVGDDAGLVQQFGHTHDEPEAATLLDPDTRKLLKSALDEMWQSELHLRQGQPQVALPYEYRALRLIKQVQNASRIYLARVGLQLPPVDETRRMGGKREGIAPAASATPIAEHEAVPAQILWRALSEGDAAARREAAQAFEVWLRSHEEGVDALGLYAALDAWRQEPACASCVAKVRASLWPLLPQQPAALAPRLRADARGQAYLDALSKDGSR
jgi:hypothetical protein